MIDKHYVERDVDDFARRQKEIESAMGSGNPLDELLDPTDTSQQQAMDDEDEFDHEMEEDENKKMEAPAKKPRKITLEEWKVFKKQRMDRLKLEIAVMGESVLEDPYKNCGLLAVMLQLVKDKDIQIAQLAMLSLTRMIVDIMPPYKIGTLADNVQVW